MIFTHLKGGMARKLVLFSGISVGLLYGCNTGVEQSLAVQQTSPHEASAFVPAVPLAVSVNAIMVAMVDHASHVVWDVAEDAKAPKNDKDWEELEHHAIQVAASGTLIALGGTGKADPGWVQSPAWKKYSQEMTDAGLAALTAVHSKDRAALLKAGDQLVNTCTSCHKEFKPDLPTEGIVHPH